MARVLSKRTIDGYHGYTDTERISRLLGEVISESHLDTADAVSEVLRGLQQYLEDMSAGTLEQIAGARDEWVEKELEAEDRMWSSMYSIVDDAAAKMQKADDRRQRAYAKIEREKRGIRPRKAKPRGRAKQKSTAKGSRMAALRKAMRKT